MAYVGLEEALATAICAFVPLCSDCCGVLPGRGGLEVLGQKVQRAAGVTTWKADRLMACGQIQLV